MEKTDGGQLFKSYRWHYNYMTQITGLGESEWGIPSPLYGIRHDAIIRSNSAQTNITEEITLVEDSIAANADARRDLRAEKRERKQVVIELKRKLNISRARATRFESQYESTTVLLAAANERLRANSLEEVTAKAAPISPNDVGGGTGGGRATGTTTPMALFADAAPITQPTPGGTA
jgi:hypothetical protein